DALRPERLAIQLTDDERLGEVLRTERQHQLVTLRLGRPLLAPLVFAARCRDQREREQQQRQNRRQPARRHPRSPPLTEMSMRSGSRRATQPPATVISRRPSSRSSLTLLLAVPSGRLIVRRKLPYWRSRT